MKEKVIEPMEKEFGDDILRITPKYKAVCKYHGCPYKLSYTPTKVEAQEDSDILTFKQYHPLTVRTHYVKAHQDKILKEGTFL